MDRRIIYDATADIAILAVAKFLKENAGVKTANKFLDDIDKKVRQIVMFPDSGHNVELHSDIQYLIIREHYNLYYTITEDGDIYLLDFWNSKRNPNTAPY